MTYQVIPRTDIGLDPVVRSSSGSPRPAIADCQWMTIHYTGVDVRYGDTGDTPAEIRAIERWAASQSKPNEYNYVIDQDDGPEVYEYAGPYRAAHSAGENSRAVGVLLLNGTREGPTPVQVDKVRWLRNVLRYFGVLAADSLTTPHRGMPGAATACPGPLILGQLDAMRQPWQEPTDPPPPPPSSWSGLLLRVEPGDGWWAIARRAYGTPSGARVELLEDANPSVGTLQPGQLVRVPGVAS